jgi:hypothetical protein
VRRLPNGPVPGACLAGVFDKPRTRRRQVLDRAVFTTACTMDRFTIWDVVAACREAGTFVDYGDVQPMLRQLVAERHLLVVSERPPHIHVWVDP